MSKYDYEIERYKVVYNGKVRRMTQFFHNEEEAVEFANSIKDKQPYVYKIQRMIFD